MENFSDWLSKTLVDKKMSQADLAAAADLDTAVISNLVNGKRGPGVDTCKAIALGFDMPTKLVFIAAGFLSPESDLEGFDEWKHILSQLPEPDRSELLEFARLKLERQKRKTQTAPGRANA